MDRNIEIALSCLVVGFLLGGSFVSSSHRDQAMGGLMKTGGEFYKTTLIEKETP